MRDFTPWSIRQKGPEPRVHTELTEPARIRISNTLKDIDANIIEDAYENTVVYTGREVDYFDLSDEDTARESHYQLLREEEDLDLYIDYLEYVLNFAFDPISGVDRTIIVADKIERAFKEEGILIQMKPSVEEMKAYSGYRPKIHERVRFRPVSDEAVINADREVRKLALGEPWDEPLQPYHDAWELYSDGEFTYLIAEKLYNSLEAVCKKICVELNDWESEKAGVGTWLSTMREKGLFDPNETMVGEWQQIQGGIQTGIQKLGGDRKDHEAIDQDYAILLLHQTSAFLTFVIKRYEDKYGTSG